MANQPQGPRPTYLLPNEFDQLGRRIFGAGWKSKLAEHIGYTPIQIGRFSGGQTAIPQTIAIVLHSLAYFLDHGIPVSPLDPVGFIDNSDGSFRDAPAPKPREKLVDPQRKAAVAPRDIWTPADVRKAFAA